MTEKDLRKVEYLTPEDMFVRVPRGSRLAHEHDAADAFFVRTDWAKNYNDRLDAAKKEAVMKAEVAKWKGVKHLFVLLILLLILSPIISAMEHAIVQKILGP